MRLCDVDADGCTEANRRVRGTGKEGSRVCTLVCAHPRVCVCVCLCVATACSLVHTYHVTHAVFLLCDAFVCPQDRWQMGVHTARDKRTTHGPRVLTPRLGIKSVSDYSGHLLSARFLFVCMTSVQWDIQHDVSMQGCAHSVGVLWGPPFMLNSTVPR